MDVKSEIKSIIAKRAKTLKEVCSEIEQKHGICIKPNNISNKFRRKTIKFDEIEKILDILDYHIEFVQNK